MILILEGLDKVGKTTLAKKLCEQFNLTLIKISQPKTKKPFYEYLNVINSLDQAKNYLFDRFYLGECAYGKLYRNAGLSQFQQHYLELKLMKFNPMLIYCWQQHKIIRQNFIKENENFTKANDIEMLDFLFRKALMTSLLPVYYYNYNIDFMFDKKLVQKTKRVDIYQDYLGKAPAKFLFVGDEPNYNIFKRKKDNMIFLSTAGQFLLSCLSDILFNDLDDVAIINSREFDSKLDTEMVKQFEPKLIICLGSKSHKLCSQLELNVSIVKVNHPQFAKRFYGKDAMFKYKTELKEVIDVLS